MQTSSLTLFFAGNPAEEGEILERLARNLVQEINQSDLDASARLLQASDTTEGEMSIEAVTLGGVAIALLTPTIPKLIDWLKDLSISKRSIKISVSHAQISVEYDLNKIKPEEVEMLVQSLSAHLPEANP